MDYDSLVVNEVASAVYGDLIVFGYMHGDGFERVFGLPVGDFLRHTLIVGSTGSGKTTTAAVLASQLVRHGHVLVIDWNDEYPTIFKSLAKGDVATYNDFKIPLMFKDFEEFISMLNDVLELSDAQTYMLYRFLDDDGNDPTIRGLINYLESVQVESRWMAETRTALLRKLKLIYNSKTEDLYQDLHPSTVLGLTPINWGKVRVISLSKFKDLKLKRLAALALIKLLEDLKKAGAEPLSNVFLFIDEAHHIANSSLIRRLVAEVRKLGIGLVLITQSPSAVSNEVLANCNLKIVHAMKSNTDIEVIVRSLGVSELRDALPRLSVSEAFVDAPTLKHVVKVRVDVNLNAQ